MANELLPFTAGPQRRSTRCHRWSARLNSRLFAGWFEKYAGVHVRRSVSQLDCSDLQKLEVFQQRNQSEGRREEQGGGVRVGEFRSWTSGNGVGDAGLIQLMVLREINHRIRTGFRDMWGGVGWRWDFSLFYTRLSRLCASYLTKRSVHCLVGHQFLGLDRGNKKNGVCLLRSQFDKNCCNNAEKHTAVCVGFFF